MAGRRQRVSVIGNGREAGTHVHVREPVERVVLVERVHAVGIGEAAQAPIGVVSVRRAARMRIIHLI